MPSYRTVVFVHGCFWHRHRGCRLAYTPKSRLAFWLKKFSDNVTRDRKVQRELRRLGWQSLVVWECEVEQRREALERRLRGALRLNAQP
jgi:DNA mismatch endonuclease (patch repair protein)